jgi:hypothetical protein
VGGSTALENTLFGTPLQSMDALAKPYAAGKLLQSGTGPDGVTGIVCVLPGAKTMRKACALLEKVSGSLGQVRP